MAPGEGAELKVQDPYKAALSKQSGAVCGSEMNSVENIVPASLADVWPSEIVTKASLAWFSPCFSWLSSGRVP